MVMDVLSITITLLVLMSVGTRVETLRIQPGASILPNTSSWPSPSGHFAFGFYPHGQADVFFVAIWLISGNNTTVVWTARRDDPPVTSDAKLQLTKDGKLVLSDEQGIEKYIAYNTSAKASSASMLDSGNFVLYNNNSNIVWQSFDYPTDTLLGGQSLLNGHQLVSNTSQNNHSSGRFCLKMQHDGNLVLYPVDTTDTRMDAYWAADTWRLGFRTCLYLNQTAGLLKIQNGSDISTTILNSDSSLPNNGSGIIHRATLNYDGIFRLYAHFNNGIIRTVASWPKEANECQVKGYCGFNSYCTFNDEQPACNCLPGYDFIHPNDHSLGCNRTFQKEDCNQEKYGATFYQIKLLEKIVWEDTPYFKDKMSQDACSSTCMADCGCDAAFYDSESCMKAKLPLRYLRRKMESEMFFGDDTKTLLLKVGNSLKNGFGNDNPAQNQPPPINTTSNRTTVKIIVITSVFSLLLCSTLVLSSHYMYKIRILQYKRLMETGNLGLNEEVTLRRFSYSELKRATNNFKQKLGKGSFGAVYKGELNKGRRLIAVKRLEKLVEDGEREFQAEMRAIGKTHHKNLVHLLGFCAEDSKRLLVYEYMPNGSLGNLIFGANSQSLKRPEWGERVRIAIEIAKGIQYLHEECEAPIIHCDIKPQNILMDDFWTPKISDFGLAKLLMPDQTRTFTGARGTRGYVAPEWHKNTPISVKADVYSYGIVLLEVLCCRRNMEVHVSEPEEIVLSNWAYQCFVGRQLNRLPFPEAVDETVVENMVKVALWCIQDEPSLRPTMKSVVLMLEGVTDIAVPPCPNYNSV